MEKSIQRWAGRTWLPWVVWGVGSLFIGYQYSFQASAAIMVKQWMDSFDLGAAGVGFLSSTFFYTYLLLQVPVGLLLDRWGVRYVLIPGLILFVLGLCLFATTSHFGVAVFARMLMGMATAPAIAAALCLGANWFSPGRFAMIVGLSETIGMLGAVFGEGVMSHWVQRLGWQQSLWCWVVVGVFMVVAMWYWVYDRPVFDVVVVQKSTYSFRRVIAEHLCPIIRNQQVWLNGLFCGLTFAVNAAFAGLWSVPYLQRVHSMSFSGSAWLSVMVYVGVMLGGPALGYFCDRFGEQRLLMRCGALAGAIVTALFIMVPIHHVLWLCLMMFAMGFCSAVYVIPFVNIKNLVPLQARGAAMAVANTFCIGIGAPLLQPFFGWVLNHGVSHIGTDGVPVYSAQVFQWAMWSLVFCSLLAFVLTFAIRNVSDYTAVVVNPVSDDPADGVVGVDDGEIKTT